MSFYENGLFISSTEIDIESDCQQIPKMDGIDGGVVCTGFIDIEKTLRQVQCHDGTPVITDFFLEKKLPFQVLLLSFEDFEGAGYDSSEERDCYSDYSDSYD